MKYLLLIYQDEIALTDSEREACYKESTQLARDLNDKGQYLAASPLQPTALANSVRVREGKRLITDGPFAETREQLGGYYLIDVQHLDEAIDIAARIPMAKKGAVEVRPVIEINGLPGSVYRAREIGEYWKLVVTNGRGSYWNCNDKKAGYHHLGIGMIHYSDVEKISNLKQAAVYLVKVDHYVRMLTPDNGRTFGRGEILPPRTSTVGRPRAA